MSSNFKLPNNKLDWPPSPSALEALDRISTDHLNLAKGYKILIEMLYENANAQAIYKNILADFQEQFFKSYQLRIEANPAAKWLSRDRAVEFRRYSKALLAAAKGQNAAAKHLPNNNEDSGIDRCFALTGPYLAPLSLISDKSLENRFDAILTVPVRDDLKKSLEHLQNALTPELAVYCHLNHQLDAIVHINKAIQRLRPAARSYKRPPSWSDGITYSDFFAHMAIKNLFDWHDFAAPAPVRELFNLLHVDHCPDDSRLRRLITGLKPNSKS